MHGVVKKLTCLCVCGDEEKLVVKERNIEHKTNVCEAESARGFYLHTLQISEVTIHIVRRLVSLLLVFFFFIKLSVTESS